MPYQQDQSIKTISERYNEIYSGRAEQISINLLGWKGGRPYVEERLSRFPGESNTDWDGGTRKDGTAFTGRKDQAHVIPYLGRIVNKINQHVFSEPPVRDGIPEDIENDISNNGKSINELMTEVNSYYSVCKWCWIGIDAPTVGIDTEISQEEKERQKIRPYWSVYSPLSVVDWYFNESGELQWILTEGYDYVAENPYTKPYNQKYRKLWEFGQVTKYKYKINDDETVEDVEVTPLSLKNTIPFVLVGDLSAEPYDFDNLESINRTIMDLESCNRQNFYNSCFPQMKVAVSVLDTVMQKFEVNADQATQMIMGFNYPILMSENDKEPGFIMPDADAIGTMREELLKLRKELFDSTGLMMQKETKQVESAEAKGWDWLDIQAVLKQRARILSEAERKAIEISNEWDPAFPVWEPDYNTNFEVVNFKFDMEALILAANLPLPKDLSLYIYERIFELLKKQGKDITEEQEKAINEAIKNYKVEEVKEVKEVVEPVVKNNLLNELSVK